MPDVFCGIYTECFLYFATFQFMEETVRRTYSSIISVYSLVYRRIRLYYFMSGGHYMTVKFEVSDEFYLIATGNDFFLYL